MIGLMFRILRVAKDYRARIRGAALFSFLKSLLSKTPFMLAFFYITRSLEGELQPIACLYMGLAMVASLVIQSFFQNMADRLQASAGFEIFADLRKKLGAHLRKLPMGFFTQGNMGRISSVLSSDMTFIEENLMMVLGDLMSYLFSAAILIIFFFFFQWRLGLLCLAISSILFAIGEAMKKNTLMHSDERQRVNQQVTESVLDFTEGIGIIKSFNLLEKKSQELTKSFEENCEKNLAFEKDAARWFLYIELVYGIGSTLMIFGAFYLCQSRILRPADLIGLLLFAFDLFLPLKAFYAQVARLTVMNSCLNRIEGVFSEPELEDRGRETLPALSTTPEVEFSHVTFAYDTRDVLKDISFTIPKNSMTALVGASGSGKSTIANLLPRFWDIRKGQILLRGKDIREISLASLMNEISMVFQRVYLFQDTVYANIAMGRPQATREEVIAAAKKARCYDFIMALEKGFDTVIGEGGASLSGGEQQRISIARCILKDAPIVILDEATASVDADNERHIQAAISQLVQGKTLLVIAHRLNTVMGADQILVLDQGEIKERGSHQELVNKKGLYAAMLSQRASVRGFHN